MIAGRAIHYFKQGDFFKEVDRVSLPELSPNTLSPFPSPDCVIGVTSMTSSALNTQYDIAYAPLSVISSQGELTTFDPIFSYASSSTLYPCQ